MRKKALLVLLSLAVVGTTGCVESVELDEEQEDKFVQYAVYAVLEHDNNYLVNLEYVDIDSIEDTTEEPTTEKTPEEPTTDESGNNVTGGNDEGNNSGDDNTITVSNMNEALGIDGLSFEYTGMTVCDSYPETEGEPVFVIKAVSGKKLVVLSFDMTNTTASDLRVDVASMNLYFKGVFNKSIKTNALVTLLPEALNTYISIIPAGQTVSTVLVYEMSDGYVNNLSEITIDVKSESGTKSIKIQ